MTPTEFTTALRALGITQGALGAELGVNPTTVWRWKRGTLPIPKYAARVIELHWREHAARAGQK